MEGKYDGFVMTASVLCLAALLPISYAPIRGCLRWIVRKLFVLIPENKNEKRAPEFLKGLPNIECNEGDKVQFRCKVTGYPQPLMLWYKDGKRIKKTDDIRMGKDNNNPLVTTIFVFKSSFLHDQITVIRGKNSVLTSRIARVWSQGK